MNTINKIQINGVDYDLQVKSSNIIFDDLSSSPRQLPYKFLGKNVWEQLILIEDLNNPISLATPQPSLISVDLIGFNKCIPVEAEISSEGTLNLIVESGKISTVKYIKLVYTVNLGIDDNGHEWVDLGLPSGLKWAKYNIGAEKKS
jgi:hypothetical protein